MECHLYPGVPCIGTGESKQCKVSKGSKLRCRRYVVKNGSKLIKELGLGSPSVSLGEV